MHGDNRSAGFKMFLVEHAEAALESPHLRDSDLNAAGRCDALFYGFAEANLCLAGQFVHASNVGRRPFRYFAASHEERPVRRESFALAKLARRLRFVAQILQDQLAVLQQSAIFMDVFCMGMVKILDELARILL